ncbi:DUF484 family protein [Inquilinus sp. CAU 1745]|uniref:DUF484 family protein n=1 Tax=Inquilinus sp. CAU 1745 TaxID=3140369 RepID=UPI00325B9495
MVQETRRSDERAADSVVTEGEVAAYLNAHPDFLIDHPEVVARMAAPTPDRPDGVVDLQSFMVERLRSEVDRLKGQQRAIISASRANHNSQNRVHAAILFLLDARNFEQLIQTITTDLAVLLDLDVACLLIESNGQDLPQALASGIRVVDEGFVEQHLAHREALLQGDIAGSEAIFGAGAGLVRSQALVRLAISADTPPCLLALGSREPDMFHEGMRTELMSFMARVLERCIGSWLDLPA